MEGVGYQIPTPHMIRALEASPSLHDLLLRYIHVLMVQTAGTAMSNGDSVLSERMARWLLMCHDRVEGDDIPLTHEFIAMMLGVRRPGVTVALHGLEGMQVIRAKRGAITVLGRDKLEELADEAYGLSEAEYTRLMEPAP